MKKVDQIAEVRLSAARGESIHHIAERCQISRNTVRKILRSEATEFVRRNTKWESTKLTGFEEELDKQLETMVTVDPKQKMSLTTIFQELQRKGYEGSYDTLRRYAREWKEDHVTGVKNAFVPLTFRPGEAFEFDWSEEQVIMKGMPRKAYVAHIKLCYSRMCYIVAYPRMCLEMVMAAHVEAHDFFAGLARRGIYDNLKAVVTEIFPGKDRNYNKQFMKLASHYLFEITACTPRSGWEKGRVEREVQSIRKKFFVPTLRVADFKELNSYLRSRIIEDAHVQSHPELQDKTIWDVFEEEKECLSQQPTPYDAYIASERRASKECLVTYDRNKYSIPCQYAGKQVTVMAGANTIKVSYNGEIIAEHERVFDRNRYVFNPEHYLEICKTKPGVLRNGRPFVEWKLPDWLNNVYNKLIKEEKGDKQLVNILCEIQIHGIDNVDKACHEALDKGLVNDVFIINILNRQNQRVNFTEVTPPAALSLEQEHKGDIDKYNLLLKMVKK